jgi:hypothetical protein
MLVTHPRAQCCWCKRALVQHEGIWWCPNPPCAQAQIDHAVVAQPKKGPAKLLYVPTPKQVEFDRCPAKYVLYGGAAGPGKSHAARWALYRRALKTPGFEALLLRKTFPELEKTHLRRMASEVPMLGGEFIESKRLARFRHKDGRVSLIECGHMDDDNAVSKYLSSEYDVIVPDEGSTFDPQALLELSTRARSSKPEVIADGGAKFWVVSNPGGPASSMLLDFFIDQSPDFDAYPALRWSVRQRRVDNTFRASWTTTPTWIRPMNDSLPSSRNGATNNCASATGASLPASSSANGMNVTMWRYWSRRARVDGFVHWTGVVINLAASCGGRCSRIIGSMCGGSGNSRG